MTRQPNLLFLWTDEQRADTLAAYGNEHIAAPNLNALASRSFVFENAYCTEPICTPSRASILTGQWPHTHGCAANMSLPKEKKTIAEMLDDEYHCAYYGKWHLGDEIIPQRGFDEWKSIEDKIYRPFYSKPEYLEKRSDYHHFLVQQGFPPDTIAADGAEVFSRNFAAALAEPYTKAAFLGEQSVQFLERQKGDRPFMLSVSFLEPHMPFFGPLNNHYNPDDLPAGPAFLQEPDENTSLRNRLFSAQYSTFGFSRHSLQTEAHWRRVQANYCGLTTMVDNAIGRILTALEKSGQAHNTIIVFTSDHGDMMGDHAMLGKFVMYQEAIRIPLLLHVPWLEGRRVSGNVSQVDLLPTLLDLMEQPQDPQLQGQSRAGVLQENSPTLDEDVVVEWNPIPNVSANKSLPPGFSQEDVARVNRQSWRTFISRDGLKINVSDDDSNELYDLNDDPYELRNRWQDAEYSGRRDELQYRLGQWQQATNDTLELSLKNRVSSTPH